MATQLFFNVSQPDWSRGEGDADVGGTVRAWSPRILGTTRGVALQTLTATSVLGPTSGIEPTLFYEFISGPIDQDITIAGTINFNLWGLESSMNANAGFGCIIERLNSQGGRVSTINQSIDNAELGTAAAVMTWTATPTSTNMLKGDRIRARVYFDDLGGTMATGFTLTFGYSGQTAAANGDSFITFTENFGFLTTAPSGSQIFLTNTAAEVDPNGASFDALEAWTSRGSGTEGHATSDAVGPTAPRQATASAGGNALEWFTKQLTAFTLDGLVACNIRAYERNAVSNAASRCEIAVTASDGTSPVVWGAANDGVEV